MLGDQDVRQADQAVAAGGGLGVQRVKKVLRPEKAAQHGLDVRDVEDQHALAFYGPFQRGPGVAGDGHNDGAGSRRLVRQSVRDLHQRVDTDRLGFPLGFEASAIW
ncbi:hypothetical protein F7Q99_29035 [Streptomyces kaniharaensis]|uniref:Uncharacterized protein n=1 Tax=Streptomyces kaniharaensis TaxID=212423 RepID=A0A6N7KZB5_9ACTN|nr:hypothetical protein [Streptomyces kaniharaensis]MQS16165.1 hypothetical protein [Streptomyces kaniharaensis]